MPKTQVRTGRGLDHPWLGAIVGAIDDRLRLRNGVIEYSQSPGCIYRIEIARSDKTLSLSDGARVRVGERLINLHLWNEHVPLWPQAGPTLGWARQMTRALDDSIRELGRYVSKRPDLADIQVLRVDMSLGAARHCDQVERIAKRLGFERITSHQPASAFERLRRFGENIFISMIVLSRNPGALRPDTLWCERTESYMSLRRLKQRYQSNGIHD